MEAGTILKVMCTDTAGTQPYTLLTNEHKQKHGNDYVPDTEQSTAGPPIHIASLPKLFALCGPLIVFSARLRGLERTFGIIPRGGLITYK